VSVYVAAWIWAATALFSMTLSRPAWRMCGCSCWLRAPISGLALQQ
jgi:hypothetical protein